jgi:hypothetical protein
MSADGAVTSASVTALPELDSRSEMIVSFDRWTSQSRDQLPINTIFYTTSVVNTPSRIEADIGMARERLMGIAMNPIPLEAKEVLDAIRLRDETSHLCR